MPAWSRFEIGVEVDDVRCTLRAAHDTAEHSALSALRVDADEVEPSLKAIARLA